eukprot:1648652-Rhodomonas_salina.1
MEYVMLSYLCVTYFRPAVPHVFLPPTARLVVLLLPQYYTIHDLVVLIRGLALYQGTGEGHRALLAVWGRHVPTVSPPTRAGQSPETRNPKPETRNPKPETRNPVNAAPKSNAPNRASGTSRTTNVVDLVFDFAVVGTDAKAPRRITSCRASRTRSRALPSYAPAMPSTYAAYGPMPSTYAAYGPMPSTYAAHGPMACLVLSRRISLCVRCAMRSTDAAYGAARWSTVAGCVRCRAGGGCARRWPMPTVLRVLYAMSGTDLRIRGATEMRIRHAVSGTAGRVRYAVSGTIGIRIFAVRCLVLSGTSLCDVRYPGTPRQIPGTPSRW